MYFTNIIFSIFKCRFYFIIFFLKKSDIKNKKEIKLINKFIIYGFDRPIKSLRKKISVSYLKKFINLFFVAMVKRQDHDRSYDSNAKLERMMLHFVKNLFRFLFIRELGVIPTRTFTKIRVIILQGRKSQPENRNDKENSRLRLDKTSPSSEAFQWR